MSRHTSADGSTGANLRLWEEVTTAYRSVSARIVSFPGSVARTEDARHRTLAAARSSASSAVTVDLYVDPVCPFGDTTSQHAICDWKAAGR
jgi:hypothetical protein